MKPARSGQLVLVEWIDARADAGWSTVEVTKCKPDVVRSVGFVVKHDDRAIVVCGDRGKHTKRRLKKDGEINRTMTIPAQMIRKVWELHT